MLVENGGNVNAVSRSGFSVLDAAHNALINHKNREELVSFLIQHGAQRGGKMTIIVLFLFLSTFCCVALSFSFIYFVNFSETFFYKDIAENGERDKKLTPTSIDLITS